MTIRYTCLECESVLNIIDEKAGTEGKCPKCKTQFLIPQPGSDIEKSEDNSPDLVDDDIDLPLELTPDVEESSEFDPADVLAGSTPVAPVTAATAQSKSSDEKRPSVAELMRDFAATRKPKERKATAAPAAKAATMATIGSATDALSRAYQQKRDKASQPKVPAREVDPERQLMYEFFVKAALGVIAVILVTYGAYSWMSREVYEGPPLADVTGIVQQGGKPLADVQIQFAPVTGPNEASNGRSNAMTGKDGSFTLKLTDQWEGAAIGDHDVVIYDASGIPMLLPEDQSRRTVTADGPNEFRFEL
jgi:phage FluMu protein Com